jgi:hypothetical protein
VFRWASASFDLSISALIISWFASFTLSSRSFAVSGRLARTVQFELSGHMLDEIFRPLLRLW